MTAIIDTPSSLLSIFVKEITVSKALNNLLRRSLHLAPKLSQDLHFKRCCSRNAIMKPTAIFNGRIADMRQQGQNIDYERAEHETRNLLRERFVEEEQASRLNAGFQPVCRKSLNIDLQLFSSADKKNRQVKAFFWFEKGALMLSWERIVTLSVFTAT